MKRILFITVALASLPHGVSGQAEPEGTERRAQQEQRVRRLNQHLAGEGPPSSLGLSNAQILIQASQTNGKAEAVMTFYGGASLTLSTPLSKNSSSTDFLSLDGLSDNLSLGLSWTGVYGLLETLENDSAGQRQARQDEICIRYGMPMTGDIPTCEPANLEMFLTQQGRTEEIYEATASIDQAFFQDARLWGISVGANIGYRSFDFFSDQAVASDAERFSRSASATFYVINGSSRWAVGLSGERSYRDARTKARSCSAVADSEGLETCRELPLGEPLVTDDVVARVEWRRLTERIGISPVLSWRIEEEVVGIDVPIYLARDAAGLLTSGIRLGWRSDRDEPQLGIFVAKPFSLF